MSPQGQSLPNPVVWGMSGLPLLATELRTSRIGSFVPRGEVNGFLFDHRGWGLANALDKFKAFTPEHHIRRVSSKPHEVSRMCRAPVLQRAVAFTFVISKRLIDFVEASLRQFNRLEDGFRNALPV